MTGPDRHIGEIWFEDEQSTSAELLIKYLFTAERLSIQVHPTDTLARRRGFPRGKDEAWFVLSAEPGAVIGIGLTRPLSQDELRAAALDGRIENLIDWRPARAGETYYSPAGTIHAIGAGIALVEIQQNLDVTYRLYDYGRPRELHLDAAVEAASTSAWVPTGPPEPFGPGREVLAQGGAFVLERWTINDGGSAEAAADTALHLIALAGGGSIDARAIEEGSVWRVDGRASLKGPAQLLAAYAGRFRDSVYEPGSEPGA